MKRISRRFIALILTVILCLGGGTIPDGIEISKAETTENTDASLETKAVSDEMTDSESSNTIDSESNGTSVSESDITSDSESGEVLSGDSTEIVAEGTCGENLTWVLTGDGTLTILGTGKMKEYSHDIYVPWYEYMSYIVAVQMDDSIQSISRYAFHGCENLTHIEIPDSVTYIGYGCFGGCHSLDRVVLSNSITVLFEDVFYNCYSLKEITIPDSVTEIQDSVFFGCSSLTEITIPENVTKIGNYAFGGCSSLTNINIPDNVYTIGNGTFSHCTNLMGVLLPEGLEEIGSSLFSSCENLSSLIIPNSVTRIGGSAFSGCKSLTQIIIPENVTEIGASAFEVCTELTDITIPENVIKVGDRVFYGCDNLTSIIILGDITAIGEKFCYNCINLSKFIMPDSVTSIGNGAFYCCENLEELTFSDSLISIGNEAFSQCTILKEVILPETINSIGQYSFVRCENLKKVSIPGNITEIRNRTFFECKNLEIVDIPDSITLIDEYAFYNCNNLVNIIIPDSVSSIGDSAFSGCSNLKNVAIDGVTEIGNNAFSGCRNLTSITIPEGVTQIGNNLFSGCSSLKTIIIPDSVTEIGNSAFSSCRNLTSIVIPYNVNSIGSNVFLDCESLKSITIPEGVTQIGNSAFSGCESLANITIPEGVTQIGNNAFSGCESMASIIIPDSVSSIGRAAFSYCISLTNIIIPDSVSDIAINTFQGCRNLTSITISDSVKSIGNGAFSFCRNLKDVYYSGSEDEWTEIAIENPSSNTYLTDATIHYNSTTGDSTLYDGDLLIKEFTHWDEQTQTAEFSTGISYHVDENTDMSFLDYLDELLGKKVLVVCDDQEIGLLKGIYPVDEIVGNISEWSPSSIILNGTEYPAAKDYSFNGLLSTPDTTSICYLHNGIVVGVISAEEKTGMLNEWNGSLNEVTIDGTVYPVKTEDLSFLQSIHNWIGHTVRYVLLDGAVIEISLPDYNKAYTGKLESYDEESGVLNFSNGESYFVSEELEESPSDYIGKWVVYTVLTSQDQGVHLTSLELVKSEMIVTMKINQNNVFYKEGQYSFDSENFVDRSDFEIPYTVTVENRTNASTEALDQLKQDEEFDITINDMEMDIQSGFNFGWLNNGEVQSIGEGTIIHAGDSVTAEGYIKPDIWYSPEELTNTYNVFCTVASSSGEDSSMDTITVTINYSDASTEELETAAAEALDEISDKIAMIMNNKFFDQKTTNRIAETLLSIAIMAKAEPQDLEEALTEDLFDEVFGDWKLKTGANTYDVPVQIAVNTVEYGELVFEFTMHLTSFNYNETNIGIFGNIDYRIVGGKGMNDVSADLRSGSDVGTISRCDVTAFCNAAYELAEEGIENAFDKVTGEGLDKVADIVFGQTIKQIMERTNKSVSDILFEIITKPGKSYKFKCPVDVYLYDTNGDLKASIVNNQIEKNQILLSWKL